MTFRLYGRHTGHTIDTDASYARVVDIGVALIDCPVAAILITGVRA